MVRFVITSARGMSSATFCQVIEGNWTSIVLNESRQVLIKNFNPNSMSGIDVQVLKYPFHNTHSQMSAAKFHTSAINKLFPNPISTVISSSSILESTSPDISNLPSTPSEG